MSYKVFVIGDPYRDVYQYGLSEWTPINVSDRFHVKDIQVKNGGAANVYMNLLSLANRDVEIVPVYNDPRAKFPLSITRLVNQNHAVFLELRGAEHGSNYYSEIDPQWLDAHTSVRAGLVISDYDKGTCNKPLSEKTKNILHKKTKFEFIIVDSRYGKFCRDYINYAGRKLLHASGNEIDMIEWFDFHYVFHTNGKDMVGLYKVEDRKLVSLGLCGVPDTHATDTTGAGDTFVASIAATLANKPNQAWDDKFMFEATELAIKHCQQVIQVLGPGIATPLE